MPRIYPSRLDTVIAIGEGQDGYFTTEQARNAGLSLHALIGLEHAGHLDREQYGLYRLARWPSSKRPGLWRTFLWATRSDPGAAFSHRTALELHGVSDINPSKIDVTFPPDVRVRSTKPPAVIAHRRDLPDGHVEERDGLRVTTLYRTLLDLATDSLARDAVADVLDRGSALDLSPEQLQQLRAIYDLSDETRQYLARTLSPARHMPGKR
jgi:predicted transcriptional regulator of viral defense system